jgi:hypothetical protein
LIFFGSMEAHSFIPSRNGSNSAQWRRSTTGSDGHYSRRQRGAIINLYVARGFTITRVEGDWEFSCITNDSLPTPVNIADAGDHVAKVERSIRTIKERTRCIIHCLPFKRIPRAIMRAAIENANKIAQSIPIQNGVSDTLSPLTTIMTGTQPQL